MSTQPSRQLERVPNPSPERDYSIHFQCDEFTCLCPRTGQPDFATIKIEYIPNHSIVELKSLKLYFWSFREEAIYHEAVANRILTDLVELLAPKRMSIEAIFKIRGGIETVVRCRHPE